MPYQTGTAADPNELLEKIVDWLESLGWEQCAEQPSGPTTARYNVHISKNGMFVNLCTTRGATNPWAVAVSTGLSSTSAGLHLYVGDGFSAAANWNAQPGAPKGNNTANTAGVSTQMQQDGPINYYGFYSDAEDNICIVFEGFPGSFSNIGWGRLNKTGIWTGGEYFFGPASGYYHPSSTLTNINAPCPAAYETFCNFYLKADVDSFIGKWLSGGSESGATRGYTGKNVASSVPGGATTPADIAHYRGLINRATTEATLAAALLPVKLWAPRDAGGHSLMGDLPGIFYSNAANAPHNLPSGSIIKCGADEYVLYPNFAIKRVP